MDESILHAVAKYVFHLACGRISVSRSVSKCRLAGCSFSFFFSVLERATPILGMAQYDLGCCLWAVLSAQCLNKVSLGVHEVKVYAVVDQIVLARRHILWRAKVHPVRFAHVLDLVVCAREADKVWVELGQVFLEDLGGVARRVAGDEQGQDSARALGFHEIKHARHLVEFFGADIGAVRKAEIDLRW
jgi:hypothetical protein